MVVDSKTFEKDFYQENEWRYTPEIDVVIPLSQFQETYELENIRAESFKLDISPNDIKYIFVKEDADIPDLFDFIKSNLSNYGEKDIKILLSRIVSLETIKLDL